MAQVRTYHVSFNPAKKIKHGYEIDFDLAVAPTVHTIETDSLATLRSEVQRLAREYGQTCAPNIVMVSRKFRKPDGFYKLCSQLDIIEYREESASEAA